MGDGPDRRRAVHQWQQSQGHHAEPARGTRTRRGGRGHAARGQGTHRRHECRPRRRGLGAARARPKGCAGHPGARAEPLPRPGRADPHLFGTVHRRHPGQHRRAHRGCRAPPGVHHQLDLLGVPEGRAQAGQRQLHPHRHGPRDARARAPRADAAWPGLLRVGRANQRARHVPHLVRLHLHRVHLPAEPRLPPHPGGGAGPVLPVAGRGPDAGHPGRPPRAGDGHRRFPGDDRRDPLRRRRAERGLACAGGGAV